MASSTDKFIKTVQAPPSKLAGPIGPEATTIPLQSLEGWASTTAVVAAIDRYDDSTNELTPSKTEIVVGIIGPNGLENVTRGVGGTKQTHSEGAVVEVSIAAGEQWNRAMDALIDSFGQDGKITKSAFAKDGDEYKQVVPGDAIEDGSLLPRKMDLEAFPKVRMESTSIQNVSNTTGGSADVIFHTLTINKPNDHFTIDSNRLTIKEPGVYLVLGEARVRDSQNILFNIMRNDSLFSQMSFKATGGVTGYQTSTGASMIEFDAEDTVGLRCSNWSVSATIDKAILTLIRIG